MTKRFLLPISLFLLLCGLPLTLSAATFQAGNTIEVSPEGNAYAAGSVVQVLEEVRGDVFLAGETVQVNARVREDAFIAGQNITINGPIEDDLHVFGETILINGDVRGDVMAFGQKIIVAPESTIRGDIIIGGASVTFNGRAERNVRLMGTDIAINGTIVGDTIINAGKNLQVESDADLRGDLLLKTPEGMEAIVPEDVVRGEITREATAAKNVESAAPAFLRGLGILSLLSRILIGAILIAFLRGFVLQFGSTLKKEKRLGTALGVGFLLLVLPPIVGIVLILPVLTLPLGILTIVAWASGLYVATLLSGLLIANLFFPMKKNDRYLTLVGKFALGTLLLSLISLVPFGIGFLANIVIYLLTLGTFFLYKNKAWKALKKAKIL